MSIPDHVYEWNIPIVFGRKHILFFLEIFKHHDCDPADSSLLVHLNKLFKETCINDPMVATINLSPNAIVFMIGVGKSTLNKDYSWELSDIIKDLESASPERQRDAVNYGVCYD